MVHSSITTVTAIVAVATVWHEYADGADWLKVRKSFWSGEVVVHSLSPLCPQAPQSSSLPVIVLAITNGYCAYDTWDMLRVSKRNVSLRTALTDAAVAQIGMARQAMNLMVHHGLLLIAFYLSLQLVCDDTLSYFPGSQLSQPV
jgi:hypothetical protein